jgi:hypothetical protein
METARLEGDPGLPAILFPVANEVIGLYRRPLAGRRLSCCSTQSTQSL